MSTLGERLNDYLKMRRALGFKLKTEGTGLATFVAFMEQRGAPHITVALALDWAMQPKTVQATQHARQLSFVRGFARYCHSFDDRTQIPPADLIASRRVRPQPYLLSTNDIERLLQGALALQPENGLGRWTFYCLYGLLSVTGLRIGEARALTVDDIDLDEGVLAIRSSKFGKSRFVPLHQSTVAVLEDYLDRRLRVFGRSGNPKVFLNDRGTPVSYDQVLDTFQRLLASIGVQPRTDGRRPHLHDLRHRFATEVLMRWYREGHDLHQRLPRLSTFLGHTGIRHTYWYLSAHPELLSLARERLEQHWRDVS